MESLSRANSAFALDLYRAISAENPDGNLFFSPLSVSAALSMVYLGARGTTADEMAKVWEFILNTYRTKTQGGNVCTKCQNCDCMGINKVLCDGEWLLFLVKSPNYVYLLDHMNGWWMNDAWNTR